ncbi:hypothetical protein BJ508DRAFT_308462 [Ascobolus immersus RN42]|uniref:Uncharacterized protein n=1 Tax=Ascobolus immersus RN42 TaxID=1160509 RepID=A0A3N4I5A8_ASCIM|nr:hypothetical protein BJ508DRAFT_308462 [Ascobolus immersus RN42]
MDSSYVSITTQTNATSADATLLENLLSHITASFDAKTKDLTEVILDQQTHISQLEGELEKTKWINASLLAECRKQHSNLKALELDKQGLKEAYKVESQRVLAMYKEFVRATEQLYKDLEEKNKRLDKKNNDLQVKNDALQDANARLESSIQSLTRWYAAPSPSTSMPSEDSERRQTKSETLTPPSSSRSSSKLPVYPPPALQDPTHEPKASTHQTSIPPTTQPKTESEAIAIKESRTESLIHLDPVDDAPNVPIVEANTKTEHIWEDIAADMTHVYKLFDVQVVAQRLVPLMRSVSSKIEPYRQRWKENLVQASRMSQQVLENVSVLEITMERRQEMFAMLVGEFLKQENELEAMRVMWGRGGGEGV